MVVSDEWLHSDAFGCTTVCTRMQVGGDGNKINEKYPRHNWRMREKKNKTKEEEEKNRKSGGVKTHDSGRKRRKYTTMTFKK